ncbi:hypothetical protein CTAYLR_004521 [Chrysophaeum taylorii]|uniref:MYND-type domain-containing protein n=1 Tax=Chrysophaeum taylorii TaxID=2483200 RepID=A0AAD7UNL4_9STRA|nr:hypothetical protein CTAYLR_004521 [Chrysophaeum taylorii]
MEQEEEALPVSMIRALEALLGRGVELEDESDSDEEEGGGVSRIMTLRNAMVLVHRRLGAGAESNEAMVDALAAVGAARSEAVVAAFRAVDRREFIRPFACETAYYADLPIHEAPLHQSAPSVYASALEALDLRPGLSFLNVGSGSGYLSALASRLVGPSHHVGIEVRPAMVEHARNKLPTVSFVAGNCYDIDVDASPRFDRVYVGAGARPSARFLFKLLKDEGILVGPFEQSDGQALVSVTRVGDAFRIDSRESHVNFAALSEMRSLDAIRLPSPIWYQAPVDHFPPAFRRGVENLERLFRRADSGGILAAVPWTDVWNRHVLAFLPTDAFDDQNQPPETARCSACNGLVDKKKLAYCACRTVAYCSKDCQQNHFSAHHLKHCPGPPETRAPQEDDEDKDDDAAPRRRRRRRSARSYHHHSWVWLQDL